MTTILIQDQTIKTMNISRYFFMFVLFLLVFTTSATAYFTPDYRYDRYGNFINPAEDNYYATDSLFLGNYNDDRRFSNPTVNYYNLGTVSTSYARNEIRNRRRSGFFDMHDFDSLLFFANLNPYDAYNADYFDNPREVNDNFHCLDLETYNMLAEKNSFDNFDPIDLNNLDQDLLDRDFLKRFDFDDYNRIANANPGDNIDPIKAGNLDNLDFDDFQCFDLDDYNEVARINPSDKWDVIDFTDFDDLDTLPKIGRFRSQLFDADDFRRFNLYDTGLGRYLNAPSFLGAGRSFLGFAPNNPNHVNTRNYPNWRRSDGGKYGFGYRRPKPSFK